MIKSLLQTGEDILHVIYPVLCVGCKDPLPNSKHAICGQCMSQLPETSFAEFANNPAEKMLQGRIDFQAIHCQYYFHKSKIIQQILHALKYRQKKQIGYLMGKKMGETLQSASRFNDIDCIIPVPMHPKKIKKRGYNQALILANGISEITGIPIMEGLKKNHQSATQTKKGKLERWLNMQELFILNENIYLNNQHILLVDDVLTTGATLEACARALKSVPNIRISIATLAIAEL
jgi:ComF family protein